MADTTPEPQTPDWLRDSPQPNEARIYVYVGPEAQLSPELHEALSQLTAALGGTVAPGGNDVQGFALEYSLSKPGTVRADAYIMPHGRADAPVLSASASNASSGSQASNFKVYINWLTGG